MDAKFEARVRHLLKSKSNEKVLRGAPAKRADSTVNAYIRQISHVYAQGRLGPDIMEDLEWTKNHESVIQTIESLTLCNGTLLKPLTKSNYESPFAILAVELRDSQTQAAYACYIQSMKLTEEEPDNVIQRKTPKELANWVAWSDILNKRNELDQRIVTKLIAKLKAKIRLSFHDKQLVIDHLILSLYTMPSGPLQKEYSECIFLMKESGNHGVHVSPGDLNVCELHEDPTQCFFHIARHKKDGVRKLSIPETLVKVILRSFNLIPHKYLILKRHYLTWNDEPIKNFTVVLNDIGQRHFERNLSCTLLRHISHTEESPRLQSRGRLRAKAKYVGHSIRTADELYNRRYA
jgi:hypothetical protein